MKRKLHQDLLETIERSSKTTPRVFRQRIWATLDRHGVAIDRFVRQIRQDIDDERSAGKGRQQRTDHNEPPAALQQRFEAVYGPARNGRIVAAPSQLVGPVERYKSDLGAAELAAWTSAIETGLAAVRQNVTSSYGESSGGSKRSGGVIDRQRLAYTTHQHTLSQIPRAWWPVFHKLIESGITVMEIGQWVLPQVTDERVLRGAGRAFLKLMGQTLSDIEIKRRGLERGETRAGQNIVNQIQRERRARGA